MWKKNYVVAGLIIILFISLGSLGYYLDSKSGEAKRLTAQVKWLKDENAVLKKEAEDRETLVSGLRNMFPQYVRESESILNELSPVIPVINQDTEEEKQMMNSIQHWMQLHRIREDGGLSVLEHNRVILSLESLGAGEDDSYTIQAMYYEIPGPLKPTGDYPRLVGKEYIGYAKFVMKKLQGDWEVSEYIDQL